jgi:preprotein translocase subunit SecD
MRATPRILTLVGVSLLATVAAGAAPGRAPQRDDTPTMTNATVEAAPAPLPADWPAGAADVQIRGANCESAYGRDAAREGAQAGDEFLPVVGTMTTNAGSALLAVRRVPFLTKRDVVRATLLPDEGDASAFWVSLELTDAGMAKVKEYTAANVGTCIAIVAGGRVVTTATVDEALGDDAAAYVLGGRFDGRHGLAIVDLFGR